MTDMLNGYDMVVALTEDTINAELVRLYSTQLTNDPNSEFVIHHVLNTVTVDDKGSKDGFENVQIDVPTISLDSGVSKQNYITLILRLLSGTYYYVDAHGTQQHVQVENWQIDCPVNVSKTPYTSDTRTSMATKEVLQSFSNANFTINSLALNFEDADSLAEDVSITFPENSQLSGKQRVFVIADIADYLHGLQGSNNPYILGYPITAAPTNSTVSIFQPVSINYSTTPYLYPAGHDSHDHSNDGLGTLNLLLMTANNPPPDSSSAGIFRTNWIDPSMKQGDNEVQGIMVVSKKVYRGQFLELNVLLHLFQLLAAMPGPLAVQTGGFVATDDHTWQLNYQHEVSNTYENADSGVRDLIETKTYINTCTASLIAGPYPLIKIAGSLHCNVSYKETEHFSGADVAGAWAWAATRVDWDSYVTFAAGQNGKILVNVAPAESYTAPQTSDKGPYYQLTDWIANWLGKGMDNTLREVQAASSAVAGNTFVGIASGISAAFTPLNNTYVFPGGSTFFFSNLQMNAEGDLLVYITYNDNLAIGSSQ